MSARAAAVRYLDASSFQSIDVSMLDLEKSTSVRLRGRTLLLFLSSFYLFFVFSSTAAAAAAAAAPASSGKFAHPIRV